MSAPLDTHVVMELRVHGVRGTSTASMLGVDPSNVVPVAGDRLTGFYRIADGANPPLRSLPRGMALEAYSWGELTSGVRGIWGWVTRVLWLGLLPFALVNLAFWARTQVGQDSGQARWGLRAVRVSGLILTVIAILTACFVSIDLIAWQCFRANAVVCPVLPDQLDMLASLRAGQRIAVMSLVPLAVIAGLVALTRQSLARYEATADDPDQVDLDRARDDRTASILQHPKMWQGEGRTRRLMVLHIAAGLSTVVLFSGVHLIAREASGWVWISTVAAGLVMLVVLCRILTVDQDDLEYRDTWRRDPGRLLRRLPLRPVAMAAAGVVLLHLVVLWSVQLPKPTRPAQVAADEMSWFGSNLWFIALFVALTIVHVIVFVGGRASLGTTFAVVVGLLIVVGLHQVVSPVALAGVAVVVWALLAVFQRLRARRPEYRSFAWGGAGGSVLLGAATMVALLYTSAATVAGANYLNGSSQGVEDLITVRNEKSPLSAQWESVPLTLAGDVVLEGARIVSTGGEVVVTGGTVRTDAMTRRSMVQGEGDSFYSMASSRVKEAVLALPEGTTSIRLESSCFSTRASDLGEVCTGESKGFRTAGALDVTTTCAVEGAELACLSVEAARGRVAIEVTEPPQAPLVVPQILVWTPLMQLAVLVCGTIITAFLLFRFRRSVVGRIRDLTTHDTPPVPEHDRPAVQDARIAAALAHRAERLLDWSGVAASLLSLVTLALSSGGEAPWELFEGLRPFATVSLYVSLAVSAALMLAGARVRRSPTARRNAGILWDITTFWPRSAQPFAPPCYAERVVPEITARVRWALGDKDKDTDRVVVLSGHSQGSLICVAVASRLNGMTRRLRLITYGSQIRALYGRVFPAAAGPEALGYVPTTGPTLIGDAWPDVPDESRGAHQPAVKCGLRYRLSSPYDWVNLYRRSDPLGYRVFSDRDNAVFDRVTLEVRPDGAGDPGSRVMTHGGYQHTPEYREAIARWTGEAVHVPSANPVMADPLPPE